jgi:hypothetical protein
MTRLNDTYHTLSYLSPQPKKSLFYPHQAFQEAIKGELKSLQKHQNAPQASPAATSPAKRGG